MRKREAIAEMLKHVQRGDAYTIEAHGEPVAIVVPWEHYENLRNAIASIVVDTVNKER